MIFSYDREETRAETRNAGGRTNSHSVAGGLGGSGAKGVELE